MKITTLSKKLKVVLSEKKLNKPGKSIGCSGLMEPDTLIRDNNNQLLRCQNGTETNIQTIF